LTEEKRRKLTEGLIDRRKVEETNGRTDWQTKTEETNGRIDWQMKTEGTNGRTDWQMKTEENNGRTDWQLWKQRERFTDKRKLEEMNGKTYRRSKNGHI
jgi:hypothetical protein